MAHFERKSALRTHRTIPYASFTVLAFRPNCTHIQKSLDLENK